MEYADYLISIHAPTNGATFGKDSRMSAHRHFNPRSDERSDQCPNHLNAKFDISIHAPTNGATVLIQYPYFFNIISIHAPTNGATKAKIGKCPKCKISIHAPTNGATGSRLLLVVVCIYFNPRSDERSDAQRRGTCSFICKFQSTLRRTERRMPQKSSQRSVKFQSTLRRTERP